MKLYTDMFTREFDPERLTLGKYETEDGVFYVDSRVYLARLEYFTKMWLHSCEKFGTKEDMEDETLQEMTITALIIKSCVDFEGATISEMATFFGIPKELAEQLYYSVAHIKMFNVQVSDN